MNDLFPSARGIPTADVFRAFYPDVDLKPDGPNRHKAMCVFSDHDRDTPSLTIYNNNFKCYGCDGKGSNIDLLIKGCKASKPLEAAKMIAERFGIPVEERKPRKLKPLTLTEYAEYLKLPQSFLTETFPLEETPKGIAISYLDERGGQVSVQMRHRLEKGKCKDNRFSWQKGGKIYLYGAWAILRWKERGTQRILLCEGASDVQVCWHNRIPALGVPGASVFRKEWLTPLLDFPELVIIREPGEAGGGFVNRIAATLKEADYQGQVKAVCLPEKDPRDLWLKHGEKFKEMMGSTITNTPAIDLYPQIPLTTDLILKVSELLNRHIFFKDKRLPLLIAVWILGTYIYDLFMFFGYLWINSPVKRCGKSLLEDIISQICNKATPRLSSLTESVAFHVADEGMTMIVDELENMRSQDREKFGALMGIINVGFQAGSKIYRMHKVEGGFEKTEFAAFCPKVLAGISKVVDTIEDRSFKISMVRKTKSERTERFNLRKQSKTLESIREELGLWAEARRQTIADLYDGIEEIQQLNTVDDRFKDISEPLIAIASYADTEVTNGQRRIMPDLISLLLGMAGKRAEVEQREAIAAFVLLAEEVLGPEKEVFIPSGDLLGMAKEVEELSWLESTKAMGTFLGKFDLTSTKRRVEPNVKQIRGYAINRGWIEETKRRYSAEEFGLIPLSPPIKVSQVSPDQSGSGSELDFGSVPRGG